MKNMNNWFNLKSKYGHLKITANNSEPQLARWVIKIRHRTGKKKLAPKKLALLEAIGFLWVEDLQQLENEEWNAKFTWLVGFKAKYGHFRANRRDRKYYKLANWVQLQRTNESKRILTADRKRRLDEIGFLWSLDLKKEQEDRWLFTL